MMHAPHNYGQVKVKLEETDVTNPPSPHVAVTHPVVCVQTPIFDDVWLKSISIDKVVVPPGQSALETGPGWPSPVDK
jgi:hypothetical protein